MWLWLWLSMDYACQIIYLNQCVHVNIHKESTCKTCMYSCARSHILTIHVPCLSQKQPVAVFISYRTHVSYPWPCFIGFGPLEQGKSWWNGVSKPHSNPTPTNLELVKLQKMFRNHLGVIKPWLQISITPKLSFKGSTSGKVLNILKWMELWFTCIQNWASI